MVDIIHVDAGLSEGRMTPLEIPLEKPEVVFSSSLPTLAKGIPMGEVWGLCKKYLLGIHDKGTCLMMNNKYFIYYRMSERL